MVNLYIDNISVSVLKNSTVLQACDSLGIDVPRFCFHERLLIAGNCRMCLVEIEKSPKPVASCALPVMEGMKVFTKTPLVKKAQEGVLEFLLLNHPLDCPICDQGGECDLQDQAMFFGSDSSRFYQPKRGVEDKNCGPLIKTIMTRCIHCTRCVRFSSEIAGVPELGTLGRGTNTQIGTYIEKTLSSELSGNMIDLCPVGALTSKPYAFKARSWELKNKKSIDISDSCGSNIVLCSKGNEVLRILPRLNENINEEWISDKTRFCYDGLRVQRLAAPFLIDKASKKSREINWSKSFELFLFNIYKDLFNLDNKLEIILGQDTDLETAIVLKHFFNKLNCFSLYTEESFDSNSNDIFFRFNKKIKDIAKETDLCILVNSDTRFEASMLNLHLRKNFTKGKLNLGYFGPVMDLTFKTNHLGLDNSSFFNLIKGKHPFCKELKKAKKVSFILNSNSFSNKELLFINDCIENLGLKSNNLNFLNLGASTSGVRDIGIQSIKEIKTSKKKTYLYVNTNFQDKINKHLLTGDCFSIYCGSHGFDKLDKKIDLILPGKAFSEKEGSFMNLEGLLQSTGKISSGIGNSREEWKIFTALFHFINTNTVLKRVFQVGFKDLFSLHNFFSEEYPFLKKKKYNKSFSFHSFLKKQSGNMPPIKVYKGRVLNFYKTNILSCLSKIMRDCSLNISKYNFNK